MNDQSKLGFIYSSKNRPCILLLFSVIALAKLVCLFSFFRDFRQNEQTIHNYEFVTNSAVHREQRQKAWRGIDREEREKVRET